MEREVLFIRHGRPASENNQSLNAPGFLRWVRDYNRADLHYQSVPHEQLDLRGYYIMCSDLHRARLSAAKYTPLPVNHYNACFNEMDIPYYRLPLTLNAWSWVYLNRFLWMLGKAGNFESFADDKVRAKYAVNLIVKHSSAHPKIALFGHGMTSRMMMYYLKKQGWRSSTKDYRYWGAIRLHLTT